MADIGSQNGYVYHRGDSLLIPALASGKGVREAAECAGIGERTATRRLSDPAFREEIQRVQTEILERAISSVSGAADDAVKTLRELLKANGENVRLGAARALLDLTFRVREESIVTDLKQRIDSLESLLKESRR